MVKAKAMTLSVEASDALQANTHDLTMMPQAPQSEEAVGWFAQACEKMKKL